MLPVALDEALGISLSEVMDHYFNRSDEAERVHLIKDALDRRRSEEEGEEWLAEEARKWAVVAELVHRGGDDTY
jgi:hypothetical protein